MRRFIISAAASALALSAFTPAMAAPPGSETRAAARPQAVMWCESGAIARRDYERQYGQAPVFMTADQVLSAKRRGETWSAPRCMTSREHARLSRTLETRRTGA